MNDSFELSDAEIIVEGKRTLEIESQAIANLIPLLDADFVKSVRIIASCKGKVILTGIGKSGIIAAKIAATLSSTGIPSVFLHPTEGAHGDLGIVSVGDVVIAISKSGETTELVNLIPFLRNRGVNLIAMVGNIRSTLARKSDAVLNCTVEREASPGNLVPAPTSSTTAALAMGDSLAVALVRLRNFTPKDFAEIHPGGSLGSRLLLRVADLMHTGSRNPMLSPSASAVEVVDLLSQTKLGAVNIVDNSGLLLGIITDGDVRSKLRLGASFFGLTANDMMTANPVKILPTALAEEAYRKMEFRDSQIMVLPVVAESGLCLGLIRLHDVVGGGRE